MNPYQEFLKSKILMVPPKGKEVDPNDIHPLLFPFQRDVTTWSIRKGRAAVFLDTGLGKTFVQLEWARLIGENTLIIAPLSVSRQTVREAQKIDLDVRYVRGMDEMDPNHKLWITNYEMAEHFDMSQFGAVVLDESSILKAINSKTRKRLTETCQVIPYRLCCTATPAPNDYIEIGNHAQFLGIASQSEMLAMFFINANKEHTYTYGGKTYHRKGSNKGGQEWRLKHHGEQAFFRWLSTWAITMTKPSDLGYDDDGFILPPLNIIPTFVQIDNYEADDQLFFTHLKGIKHRSQVRRDTLPQRLEVLAELVNNSDEQWIIWAGLNEESKAATAAIDGAVEVRGDQPPDYKAQTFEQFQDGEVKVLVTKTKIGGFGLNMQNAHNMAFLGLSDSWESYYQAVRREWRYRQKYPVNVHIIMSSLESEIYQNVMRKDAMAARLRSGLVEQIKEYEKGELEMIDTERSIYDEDIVQGENWTAMLGDSCKRMGEIATDSIDLSVYSPPFADLYTYTDSERDLGNCKDWGEFFGHYAYIVRELLRITKPGRLTCCHCMDIPAMMQKDGWMGLKDFSGALIQAYTQEGWTLHDRVVIDKNPQAQAIRTHSHGLLFKTLDKDSIRSHTAIPDQILVFRKDGDNQNPVRPVENGDMDNEVWIQWARPIWYAADYTPAQLPNPGGGISETGTLQFGKARGTGDEKHICPLQLGTIERCIKLWSNPGETVFSPFAGIGSEGYQALSFGRKFIGIELKPSYFAIMLENLNKSEIKANTPDLFSLAGIAV